MKKRVVLLLAVSSMLWGCAPSRDSRMDTGEGRGEPPVIIDSYAAEVIRPGTSWRVYLHAKDEDGDMRDIASVLSQPGIGTYPTDFTRIKAADAGEIAGFLFLNTPSDTTLSGPQLN